MQISIATLNLWGLPWPFSIHKTRRLQDFFALVRREQFHIIALQEVFLRSDVQAIQRALPEYHVFAKTNTVSNVSGLVLLSLFDLTDCRLTLFDMPIFHKEIPSRKGLLQARIHINDKEITLCDTHLYFGGRKKLHTLQHQQFKQLRELLPTTPTILCGDFNVDYHQVSLPEAFILLSNKNELTIQYSTRYAHMLFNKVHGRDRNPDMIFANFPTKVTDSKIITEPLLSDHFPVVTTIEV